MGEMTETSGGSETIGSSETDGSSETSSSSETGEEEGATGDNPREPDDEFEPNDHAGAPAVLECYAPERVSYNYSFVARLTRDYAEPACEC